MRSSLIPTPIFHPSLWSVSLGEEAGDLFGSKNPDGLEIGEVL
jgi:hypothetical protein